MAANTLRTALRGLPPLFSPVRHRAPRLRDATPRTGHPPASQEEWREENNKLLLPENGVRRPTPGFPTEGASTTSAPTAASGARARSWMASRYYRRPRRSPRQAERRQRRVLLRRDGVMQANRWIDQWTRVSSDSGIATSTWLRLGDKWFYANENSGLKSIRSGEGGELVPLQRRRFHEREHLEAE